jgi:hypothetical protein
LEPFEVDAHANRHAASQHCFAGTRYVFQQNVPLAQQRNQQEFDLLSLADDDFFDVFDDFGRKIGNFARDRSLLFYHIIITWIDFDVSVPSIVSHLELKTTRLEGEIELQ